MSNQYMKAQPQVALLLKNWRLSISPEDVLLCQGIDPKLTGKIRPQSVKLAEWAIAEGMPLISPAVLLKEYPVLDVRHKSIFLAGGGKLTGSLVVDQLAPSTSILVFLCTIGKDLENMVSAILPDNLAEGMALDGFASAAVTALATQVCRIFDTKAHREGLQTSIPLSPGMEGWGVKEGQTQIAALLNFSAAGVQLSDDMVMSPMKSLTQVIGIGPQMDHRGRTCDYCNMRQTCKFRAEYSEKN